MKIAFIWQGFSGVYGHWNDGLKRAMDIISMDNIVRYFDTDLTGLDEFNPDVCLYWEAPCTFAGKDRENYQKIQRLPYKKALLFAGGPIKEEWCGGFDLFFVESAVNEKEFSAINKPWKRAFGVNVDIFKPQKQPKIFKGMFQATCASWKRHWLLAEAFGSEAVFCGRDQKEDGIGFIRSRNAGSLVLPELPYEAVSSLINSSYTVVNCSDYWGGGQRTTLEAMACGVPVVVMEDSIKNREYVEDAGIGSIINPSSEAIKNEVEKIIKDYNPEFNLKFREYVLSKWTSEHYAKNLLDGIKEIC